MPCDLLYTIPDMLCVTAHSSVTKCCPTTRNTHLQAMLPGSSRLCKVPGGAARETWAAPGQPARCALSTFDGSAMLLLLAPKSRYLHAQWVAGQLDQCRCKHTCAVHGSDSCMQRVNGANASSSCKVRQICHAARTPTAVLVFPFANMAVRRNQVSLHDSVANNLPLCCILGAGPLLSDGSPAYSALTLPGVCSRCCRDDHLGHQTPPAAAAAYPVPQTCRRWPCTV
jgi:hypothetical protein